MVATLILNGSAYLYNVACIRYLGPSVYGDIAAMLALGALVALPLGSIQFLLAREVAQLPSKLAARLLRRATGIGTAIGLSLLLLGVALVDPIRDALNVESREAVTVGISAILFAVIAAVFYGFLQGRLRFKALGLTYSVSGIARPVLVVPALLLGFGATGVLAVNVLAGVIAVVIAAYALRDLWFLGTRAVEAPHLDRRQMAVMLIGSLAFASLTNVDILLAAYYLDNDSAGIYAAAALAGKVVLFLPSAVVTVLLPKAATRAAAGITSRRILLASAGVTVVVTAAATGLLALVPESLLTWAFGPAFRDATDLLGWFGLAMSAAALVSVYLSVYFAERDARFPLLVLAAAVAQVIGVSVWHSKPLSIVLVTLVCASAVLVVHELAFPYALRRSFGRAAAPAGAADSPVRVGRP
jgi:O-antigen/teichoic acid export membrane protein